MSESQALELGKGREEVLRELGERRLVVVELGADRTAVSIDGVVAAPQDPAIGGQPVVVELVAHVADALARRPSRSRRAAGRRAARSPARSRTPARCSGRSRAAAAGRRWSPAARGGVDDAAFGDHRDAGAGLCELPDRAVLVDLDARPRPPPRAGRRRACRGGRARSPVRVHSAAEEQSASSPRPGSARRRAAPPRARTARLARPPLRARRARAVRARRSRSPVASNSASIPRRSRSRGQRRKFSRPSRSSCSSSSGNRDRPLPIPWVSEDCRKPPLRPLAPAPHRVASSTTTSRAGSSSFAYSAAHSPVKPPPTMHSSASSAPSSGGCGITRRERVEPERLARASAYAARCAASEDCRATAKASRDPSCVSGDVPARG